VTQVEVITIVKKGTCLQKCTSSSQLGNIAIFIKWGQRRPMHSCAVFTKSDTKHASCSLQWLANHHTLQKCSEKGSDRLVWLFTSIESITTGVGRDPSQIWDWLQDKSNRYFKSSKTTRSETSSWRNSQQMFKQSK
jgi:hypothetical protein